MRLALHLRHHDKPLSAHHKAETRADEVLPCHYWHITNGLPCDLLLNWPASIQNREHNPKVLNHCLHMRIFHYSIWINETVRVQIFQAESMSYCTAEGTAYLPSNISVLKRMQFHYTARVLVCALLKTVAEMVRNVNITLPHAQSCVFQYALRGWINHRIINHSVSAATFIISRMIRQGDRFQIIQKEAVVAYFKAVSR